MSRFLLDTDTLYGVSENIYKYSQQLLELSETVGGYSIDSDTFDFVGAKNKIAENLNKMNIRVANISQVISYTADSHTAIQSSLECSASDCLNVKQTSATGGGEKTATNKTTSYKQTTETTTGTTSNYSQPATNTTAITGIQISNQSQEEKNTFVNYFQQDYTNAYGEGATIASKGAAPTAMAMILTALKGEEITPVETAQWSLENGFVTQENNAEVSYFDSISEAYGIDCEQVELTQENILASISEGKYMIVSMGEGQFGETGNYVVITGISSDGKITVADPNSQDNSTKTWDISVFLNEGTKLWVF